MAFTPFDLNFIPTEFAYLNQKGLMLTDSVKDADIIIASSIKQVRRKWNFNLLNKPILIWTNEPRVSTSTRDFKIPFSKTIIVKFLNIYSGNVFINNVTYQQKRFQNSEYLNKVELRAKPLNRKPVALMSYYKGLQGNDLKIRGENIDLINMRNKLAVYGHKLNKIDIYGRGWPEGMIKENSRDGNWTGRKKELLTHYDFNFAFENSVYPNYVTEKIWDAIENYCLPIYFGGKGSTIYKDFPENSFLDYSKYASPEILYKKIDELSNQEFTERLNLCIEVYNQFVEKDEQFWLINNQERLDHIVNSCQELV